MFGSRRAEGRREQRSERSAAIAQNAMVATGHTLASSAALSMLRAGGNAIDAALAAVAVKGVVDPYSTGIGGDCFLLAWIARERKLYALNGSGRAPARATVAELRARGEREMPFNGILSVTVPGAVDAWCEALARFGTRPLADVLAPAIELAEQGYPVSEVIAHEWGLAARAGFLRNDAARRCFAPGGEPPRVGQIVRLPELAASLRLLAREGRDAFYRGELAAQIVRCAEEEGGLLALDDLAEHRSTWVEPIATDYRGYRLCELPPNVQGLAALIALNILEGFDLPSLAVDSPDAFHLRIEAVKLALADRNRFIADPEQVAVPTAELLSKEYGRRRAGLIDPRRAAANPAPGDPGRARDTVNVAVVDREGNAVSAINSLFGAFGSGIVAGTTGIALQNRGAAFSFDPAHPNALAPRKRPMHTLVPAMLLQDGLPRVAFSVMGGHIQAQAHVQVVSSLVDHGLNVQEAIDLPRFHAVDGARVCLEPDTPAALASALEERGHELLDPIMALSRGGFGGAQAIAIDPATGARWGASDRRKDGCAIGY